MSTTTSPSPAAGYSADVQLLAYVDGRTHRLSHVGPDEIIFVEPLALSPGLISVDVVIDDHRQTYHAAITHTVPAGTLRVPVRFSQSTRHTAESNH